MSRYLVDRIQRLPNVHVSCFTEVTDVIGEERFAGLVVVNSETGGRQELAARASSSSSERCRIRIGWVACSISMIAASS